MQGSKYKETVIFPDGGRAYIFGDAELCQVTYVQPDLQSENKGKEYERLPK